MADVMLGMNVLDPEDVNATMEEMGVDERAARRILMVSRGGGVKDRKTDVGTVAPSPKTTAQTIAKTSRTKR